MTQVAFNAIGSAIGGPVGGMIGSTIGSVVDAQIINSLQPARQVGPRLEGLKVQGAAEGAPLPCVFGRARVAGQVIWATRFWEQKRKQSGGKGGQRTFDYGYSLSFAVGLGEGEIDGVGRIWADGMPMDLAGVTYRVHRGGEAQMPDPLIEAVEGQAPAYRGTAYVVFEDLSLEAYGNRLPQLSFEVFKRARGSEGSRLEDRLQGVCLIPGAGEFCLASELVKRREGLTRSEYENGGSGVGRADLEVSLDQLVAQLPNVKRVNLVVGWFGTDVRAGHCQIRPGVESRTKRTVPLEWSVAGVDRGGAHLVSRDEAGAVAYGGTPSDESVRQAIRAIKARGLEVVIYPFVFMDCEGYPWRGRIKGTDGSGAVAEVAALFGTASDWGLRRQVLHYAQMAKDEGADGLVIGSEMRGLTLTRDGAGGFPAVAEYRALVAECRAVVGAGVELTYAADWSEYAGLRQGGEVRFHLDPLWADPNIDYVGIDWYPPMGDWRGGDGGLDAEAYSGCDDVRYLAAQVAGGRDFDWYYASEADEAAQVRTPIADGAYGEDWVWRIKDLKGWWSHDHYEREGGVKLAQRTAWRAGMKPVRLLEFGCAAVDRGGNAPNLFLDPKSSESALPPYSDGTRNDVMQRALMEAVLGHFAQAENNPVSSVYGAPMLAGADAWCWDARPWPAFPAREDLWSDAGAWRTGHWLNGRMQGAAGDLVEAVLKRAGLPRGGWRVEGLEGVVSGLVIERPMTTRAALEGLLLAIGAVASERGGQVVVSGGVVPSGALSLDRLALEDEGQGDVGGLVRTRELKAKPQVVRVRFIHETADYQTGAVVVRAVDEAVRPQGAAPLNHGVDVDVALVMGPAMARHVAKRVMAVGAEESRQALLGPLEAISLEAGDVVAVEGEDGLWRVRSLDYGEVIKAGLEPVVEVPFEDVPEEWSGGVGNGAVGAPWVKLLDLPPLAGSEEDGRPLVAVAADPWWPMVVHGGGSVETLSVRAEVRNCATVGELVEPLAAGPLDRWDEVNSLVVRLEGGNAQSLSETGVLDGGNMLAVETAVGWELVQYREAQMLGGEVWKLSGLLRARQGTESACEAGALSGAAVVVVDGALVRVSVDEAEKGLPRLWRVGPAGLPPGGSDFTGVEFSWERRQARPWRPVHLKAQWSQAGLALGWIGRVRTGGDGWDQQAISVDPDIYRLSVMSGTEVLRQWQVEGTSAVYSRAEFEADFAQMPSAGDRIEIAQKGRDGAFGEAVVYNLG